LDEATKRTQELLDLQPDDLPLLNRLGNLYLLQRRPEEAVTILAKSLNISPDQIAPLSDYATGLWMLGRFEAALEHFDRILLLQPNHADVFNNRGAVLQKLRRPEDALASYSRAIALRFDFAEAYYNRGNVLTELQRFIEAVADYDRAIALRPDDAKIFNNRSIALQKWGRSEEALLGFERAISLQPGYAEAHYNRGNVLQEKKRSGEAIDGYDLAIALRPHYAEAYHGRGEALLQIGRLEDSLASFDHAIALRSDFAEAHYGRGNALRQLKRFEESVASFDHAIALQPDFVEAQWNKSLHLLLHGEYQEGWRLYEWRWKVEMRDHIRDFKQPLWLGDKPIANRTLLIHAEQGYGDTLQFCRYVRAAEALGAKIVLEVPKALFSLLATMPGNRTLVTRGEPLPDFDLHCPMLSLPWAFKTTLDTIPADVPYLFADPHQKADWQQRLGTKTRPRIGLAWSGKPGHKNDRHRSIALETLVPLLALPFEFHSLQNEYRENEESLLKNFQQLRNHQNDLRDFADTAALVSEMDFVVAVDTAVAHLSGALGKPVWILLPFVPDYRWLLDRPESPWYPTASLFRQTTSSDWETVISDVIHRLPQALGQSPA
jgi:hypothetical protein